MTHKARRVVLVTEKLILDGVVRIIEANGATGYTVVDAGGKGSRNVRSVDHVSVVDAFTNVRIEVVTTPETAERIAEEVAATYFENYSGIVTLEDVEVLRLWKFHH